MSWFRGLGRLLGFPGDDAPAGTAPSPWPEQEGAAVGSPPVAPLPAEEPKVTAAPSPVASAPRATAPRSVKSPEPKLFKKEPARKVTARKPASPRRTRKSEAKPAAARAKKEDDSRPIVTDTVGLDLGTGFAISATQDGPAYDPASDSDGGGDGGD